MQMPRLELLVAHTHDGVWLSIRRAKILRILDDDAESARLGRVPIAIAVAVAVRRARERRGPLARKVDRLRHDARRRVRRARLVGRARADAVPPPEDAGDARDDALAGADGDVADLRHRAAGGRERGRVLARLDDDLGREEQAEADLAVVAVLRVRERDAALDGGEGLEALEVDCGLSQALRLFDLVPVKDFEREVGTSTRGLSNNVSE